MSNVEDKIDKLKSDIQSLNDLEKVISGRIQQLNSLLAEKKNRLAKIEGLKNQEADLLKQLGE